MLNDRTTPAALCATRRSGKPQLLGEPGPSPAQLDAILSAAMRVPDHGKLSPWRFVVIGAAERAAFAQLLVRELRAERPDAPESDAAKLRALAHAAPVLLAILSAPVHGHKIPVWEQELSAGAACMALLYAAHAHGFAASWVTGWAAYAPAVHAALGGAPGGRVAGFVHIGTPAAALEERARPRPADVVRPWLGPPAPARAEPDERAIDADRLMRA
jgi:nitroreductase